MGAGYAREQVKEFILNQGIGFVSSAVIGLDELAAKLIRSIDSAPSNDPIRVLGPFARQEILRMLLSERRISLRMPELRRLRRRRGFFKRLDRSIQSARMGTAHADERKVLHARLDERVGRNPLRQEIALLSDAYEAWLEASGCYDLPLLLKEAIELLRDSALDEKSFKSLLPQEILYFTARRPENLEQEFIDEVSRRVPVEIHAPWKNPIEGFPEESLVRIERWHSLDDAAEALCDALLASLPEYSLSETVILIPDVPSVRRSLMRVLREREVPLADPRDPTRLRSDERLKRALLPWSLVAGRFERPDVLSWIHLRYASHSDRSVWVEEINARGIRRGLETYAGGLLQFIHQELSQVELELGGKRTCREFFEVYSAHLLRESSLLGIGLSVQEQLNALFEELCEDIERIGQGGRRAHPLYWLERFQERLEEATPPAEKLRPMDGVVVHRLGQALLSAPRRLWFFGFPADWIRGERAGDYAYTEREREVLSSEFGLRSSIQVQEEREAILKEWFSASEERVFWDAEYDWDGRERESLQPFLREMGFKPEIRENGGHGRWLASYHAVRPIPEQNPKLEPLEISQIYATQLEHYSRCPFIGLVAGRWRLWDQREPQGDLWPDVRGNILHSAIKELLESRLEDGSFGISSEEALEKALSLHQPKGLLISRRLMEVVRKRMLLVLQTFLRKEEEYVKRSGAKVFSLEGPELSIQYPDFRISGVPDRIDSHEEGLFIMDYKSSSNLPNGVDILEFGYRLQVPFYALAAQAQLGAPVIGIQYVELNKKGGRTKGIFFKKHNGKEKGKPTNVRSNSKSLVDLEPDEAWSKIEEMMITQAADFLNGKYPARPRLENECNDCRYRDLCGRRRLGVADASGGNS